MNSLLSTLLFLLLLSLSIARPPGRDEHDEKLLGGEPMSKVQEFDDYFEDFFPVLQNSSRLHENYHLEKKKYLTSVLGFPAKMRKMK